MKPYYDSPEGVIYHGNSLEVLKSMASESIQCVVTSPPYWGLRDYNLPPMIWDAVEGCEHEWGEDVPPRRQRTESDIKDMSSKEATKPASAFNATVTQFCQTCGAWRGCLGLEPTPELFIHHMVQIFAEVKRVLRSDGVIFVNMGDSYAGSGSPGGDFRDGKGGDEYLRPYNRKGSGLKPKDLCGIPWMLAFALRADGWYLRSDIIWHKPNPMPESCRDRPTKSHEYIFLLTKSAKYFYDADAIREKHQTNLPVVNKSGGGRGAIGHIDTGKDGYGSIGYNPAGRNKRTVWTIATQPFPGSHFAVFPEKLIEPCILAGTSEKGACAECGSPLERIVEKSNIPDGNRPRGVYYESDRGDSYQLDKQLTISKTIGWQPTCKCGAETEPCVVLDIFGGAMTTAIVAHRHGRKFVMIELSKTYIDDIGIPRIKKATEQLKLF